MGDPLNERIDEVAADLAELRREVRAGFAQVQTEFAAVRAEFAAEQEKTRTELRAEFAAEQEKTRTELRAEFAAGHAAEQFAELRDMIRLSYTDLDRRVRVLEGHAGV